MGDRAIFADHRATIGDLVRGLGGTEADAMVVRRTGNVLLPTAVLGLSDLRSGDVVELESEVDLGAVEAAVGEVAVVFLSGPRTGDRIVLGPGRSRLGRAADNDIVIVDPGISRHHAAITVDGMSVSVSDAGSTNGVMVANRIITGPTPLNPGQRLLIGQVWLEVEYEVGAGTGYRPWSDYDTGLRKVFVSPGTKPHKPYSSERIIFPAPPARGRSWRRSGTNGFEAAASHYERSLQEATATLVKELDAEWTARLAEAPPIGDVIEAVNNDIEHLWPRTKSDPLLTRLGLASLPSRVNCVIADGGDDELRARAVEVVDRYRTIDGVPVVVDFESDQSVLVAGYEDVSRQLAYGLLGQLAAQHQPNRLRIWGLLSPERVSDWDWLKWLPHCDGFTDRDTFAQLTADPAEYQEVVERLVASVSGGALRPSGLAQMEGPVSAILLIDGEAPVPNRVQAVIESLVTSPGNSTVSALVVGPCDPAQRLELPFGQKGTVVIVDREYASMETIDGGTGPATGPVVLGIDYEPCSLDQIDELARRMTYVEPRSVESESESSEVLVPSAVWGRANGGNNGSGLEQLIRGADPAILVEQWAEKRPPGQLLAHLGRSITGPVIVDLRELGPHAVVSGELEGFLPAWISSLAARYSPTDLNFYLIDSTGGAVFRSCRELPHTIGNLSNTSTLEIKPALAMLSAELDRRDAVLTSLDSPSVEDLERRGHSLPFPYLVIAIDRVDELDARRGSHGLVGDGGEESVVTLDPAGELLNLAERGQRLGVHLLLGSSASIDSRLSERIALRINAARYGPSHLSVGLAPVVPFDATLTRQQPEVVVRSFAIDDTSERSRELLTIVDLDDLEQVTTLIRNAHEFSGDSLPSGLG